MKKENKTDMVLDTIENDMRGVGACVEDVENRDE